MKRLAYLTLFLVVIDPLESWKVAWHEYLVVSSVTMILRHGMHKYPHSRRWNWIVLYLPICTVRRQQPVPGADTMMIRIMTFITGQFQERSHGS